MDEKEGKILPFRKKEIKIEGYPIVAVFIKNGNIGIEIKNGAIMLTPYSALQVAIVIVAAIKAIFEMTLKGE